MCEIVCFMLLVSVLLCLVVYVWEIVLSGSSVCPTIFSDVCVRCCVSRWKVYVSMYLVIFVQDTLVVPSVCASVFTDLWVSHCVNASWCLFHCIEGYMCATLCLIVWGVWGCVQLFYMWNAWFILCGVCDNAISGVHGKNFYLVKGVWDIKLKAMWCMW